MTPIKTPPAVPAPLAAALPPIDSQLLFGSGRTVQIAHQGQTYTLRITRENKLILTK